jgi:pyruvate dehydrogenase kinase 2/3/4
LLYSIPIWARSRFVETILADHSPTRRYFSPPPADLEYPPEVHEYNEAFTALLQNIKKRHDPTVTTVAQGVLEWKRKQKAGRIGQSIQEWLDRFYMSRIGIRFLIGQRE